MIPTIVNCHLLTVCVRADLVKQAKKKKWKTPGKGEKIQVQFNTMDAFSLGQKLTTRIKGRKILSGNKYVLRVLFWSLCNVLTIWHQLLKCHVGH